MDLFANFEYSGIGRVGLYVDSVGYQFILCGCPSIGVMKKHPKTRVCESGVWRCLGKNLLGGLSDYYCVVVPRGCVRLAGTRLTRWRFRTR